MSVDPLTGYSAEAAGELLGVSGEVVRRMLQRGDLKGRLVGNRWRVPRFEIERFWAGGERPVASVLEMRRPTTGGRP